MRQQPADITSGTEPTENTSGGRPRTSLPMVFPGIIGGLTAMLCCVGPTVLALIGVMSAATAFSFATTLYNQWAWAFRLTGLAVTVLIVWWALRRRKSCTLRGVRASWKRLTGTALIAVATYAILYLATTLLGQLH